MPGKGQNSIFNTEPVVPITRLYHEHLKLSYQLRYPSLYSKVMNLKAESLTKRVCMYVCIYTHTHEYHLN